MAKALTGFALAGLGFGTILMGPDSAQAGFYRLDFTQEYPTGNGSVTTNDQPTIHGRTRLC